ncbi:bacillithiol biosynthesis deacetylase BshB1 [Myxococcota bacterium]|nr:bacillithiol biosynthesis deacetylase BshB1 [Myxococcota bacterium]
MNGYGIDVLAFGAHPDDVELFAGGTVARLVELGYSVGVVDLTRGERASHGTVEERAREADAAAEVLGLTLRENVGLPDGLVDPASPEQLVRVVEVLRRRRPEIVLIPWIEERHPDHEAAGWLLKKAVFFAGVTKFDGGGERFVPRQIFQYSMRHRMTPSFILDTSSVWEKKLRAIYCHASQVTRRPGDAPTLVSSPRAIQAIEARDRYHGSMIGAAYGEPLRMPNVPGLVDPIKHVRDNPFTEAHAFEPER